MIPKLALCCICGNESKYARRFLEAFRPHVDAMVVVRACGAAAPDNTIDLAKEFNCITAEYKNAPESADWPHIDNFAAARNMAFDLAPADCEWLLWADFDDEVDPEALAKLRAYAASPEDAYDWFFCRYDLVDGENPFRERMVRRGTARWIFRIHEHLAPPPGTKEPRKLFLDDVSISHAPSEYKEGSFARNLRILEKYHKEHSHYVFYLHKDYFLHQHVSKSEGDRVNAMAYGYGYLEFPDRADVFAYEVLLNLSQLEFTWKRREELAWKAYALMPWLREAPIALTMYCLDLGQRHKAKTMARLFSALPLPPRMLAPYFVKQLWYGWRGVQVYAEAHRFAGDETTARKNEDAMLERGGKKISLLHATRGRSTKAFSTRNTWYQRAMNPEGIEHIFAIDDDDRDALEKLIQFRKVVVPHGRGCVAAWNAAAADSVCDVLVQLSDDWEPPAGWDAMILERIGDTSKPAVLAISDGHRNDQLLCMAILTRERYEQAGLFHPDYTGVYSDNEFTDQSYADGVVIEARDLVFQHHHPILTGDKAAWDKTYAEQNSPERYAEGKAIYERRRKLWTKRTETPLPALT